MDKEIGLNLGKLLVAVAWADGELQDEEIQILKDTVYKIPNLSREDWASIEVYMEEPITADETRHLMEKFKAMIKSEEDKQFAIRALRDIIYADGEVTSNEARLYQIMADEIRQASSGFDKKLEAFFTTARSHRKRVLSKIPKRERNLDDFVDNPVFYRSFRRLADKGVVIHMDKSELEHLCVAGALMACIAQADGTIAPEEVVIIERVLVKEWRVSAEAASIVAEISVNHEVVGMDLLRLCRKFFAETEPPERMSFFKTLIAVVKSDLDVHANELERLRSISTHLKIPNEDVLELMPRLGPVAPDELDEDEEEVEEEEEHDWRVHGDPDFEERDDEPVPGTLAAAEAEAKRAAAERETEDEEEIEEVGEPEPASKPPSEAPSLPPEPEEEDDDEPDSGSAPRFMDI